MKIWLNGKIVDDKDAKVSIFDRGFLYGDGVFETMRSYDGKAFKLDEHLDRLYNSQKITEIKIPYSKAFLKKQIYRLLKINELNNAYIRITVTRGVGTVGLARIECKNPTVAIIVKEFEPYPAKMYKNGISVKIVKVRQNENSPVCKVKSTSFLNYILARLASHRPRPEGPALLGLGPEGGACSPGARHRGEAKKAGFDDAIMLNSKGEISESTVSNIFLIKAKMLITPSLDSGVLPGITRSVIIELAPRLGLKAKECMVKPELLYKADEVFLTNSLMEVMPVVKVDNRVIGSGRPGVLTRRIHREYKRVLQRL